MKNFLDLQTLFFGPHSLEIRFALDLLEKPELESPRVAALQVALRSELIAGGNWTGPSQIRILLGANEREFGKGENQFAEVKLTGFRRGMSDEALAELVLSALVPVMSKWFPRAALKKIASSFFKNGLKYEWRSPALEAGPMHARVMAKFGMRRVDASLQVEHLKEQFQFPLFSCPPGVHFWMPRLGRLASLGERVWVEMVRGAMFADPVKGRPRPRVFVTGHGEAGVRRIVVSASPPLPVVLEDWSDAVRAGKGIATWRNRGWSRQTGK